MFFDFIARQNKATTNSTIRSLACFLRCSVITLGLQDRRTFRRICNEFRKFGQRVSTIDNLNVGMALILLSVRLWALSVNNSCPSYPPRRTPSGPGARYHPTDSKPLLPISIDRPRLWTKLGLLDASTTH